MEKKSVKKQKEISIIEDERHNLYKLLGTVHHLVFLTSGQCLIFDKEEKQICHLQQEFTSGETNIQLLKLVAEHAEKFTLGKFREWMQEMDKEEFLRVTHLYCSEMFNSAAISRFDSDVFMPPFRLGIKQKRAILDAKGREVIIMPNNSEKQAQLYCNYLNGL